VVHVITGNGRRSKTAPVLKPTLKRLLKELKWKTALDLTLSDDEGASRRLVKALELRI